MDAGQGPAISNFSRAATYSPDRGPLLAGSLRGAAADSPGSSTRLAIPSGHGRETRPLRRAHLGHPRRARAAPPDAGGEDSDRRALRAAGASAAAQRGRPRADPLLLRRAPSAMSELRFNELRGEPVAYAIHRQDRTFLPDRAHCPLDPDPARRPADRDPRRAVRDRRLRQPLPRLRGAGRGGGGGRLHRRSRRLARLAADRARGGADVGVAQPLRGARRARGRRVRLHLRKPRRRGRRDAAPPPRPDLRLPLPAARARARDRSRRAARRLRAVRARRARARGRAADALRERGGSAPTCPRPRAGPSKPTS